MTAPAAEALLAEFRRSVSVQADALERFLADPAHMPTVARALEILQAAPPPVLFIGIGKSGHICRKMAATFASVGLPALFVNAGEALHGDCGMLLPGRAAVLVSYSGTTREVLGTLPVLHKRDCPVIALTGNADSPLGKAADVTVRVSVTREADTLGIAPTASTTLALVVGDALASALMKARGTTPEEFLENHPGGRLGAALSTTVERVMRRGAMVPRVRARQSLLDAKRALDAGGLGFVCVEEGRFLGVLTDAVLAPALRAGDARGPADLMSDPSALLRAADDLHTAETTLRRAMVEAAPVVDADGRLVGIAVAGDIVRAVK